MGELNSSALTHHLHLKRTMVVFRQGDMSQPAQSLCRGNRDKKRPTGFPHRDVLCQIIFRRGVEMYKHY